MRAAAAGELDSEAEADTTGRANPAGLDPRRAARCWGRRRLAFRSRGGKGAGEGEKTGGGEARAAKGGQGFSDPNGFINTAHKIDSNGPSNDP